MGGRLHLCAGDVRGSRAEAEPGLVDLGRTDDFSERTNGINESLQTLERRADHGAEASAADQA